MIRDPCKARGQPDPDRFGRRQAMSRRLLFVVNDASYFISHRIDVAIAAREAGWDVHIATIPSPPQVQIRAAGFLTHSIPLTRFGLRPDKEFLAMLAIWRLLRQVKPDLVHLGALKAIVLGGFAARLAGVPSTVLAVTGLGQTFTDKGLLRRALASLLLLLFPVLVTRHSRVILQNREDLARVARTKAVRQRSMVIPGSGVDLTTFRPSPEPPEPVAVLMPSRMLWKKGVGEFVEAGRRLKREGISARFFLAGDNDEGNPGAVPRQHLEAWTHEGVLEWLGFQSDMPALMAKSHIICLPTYYGEGVPKCLLEAAAAGRAIVTTNMPGCRDIVRDGENGFLVSPQDPESLADALRRLITDGELRRSCGARGREIAVQGFDIKGVIADTLSVYEELAPWRASS